LRIPIHSVSEGGLLPELVANLLAAVAEEEVRRVRERSAATHRFVLEGSWHYPTRPAWGYRRRLATPSQRAQGAPHTVLEVDSKRARYVREAFRRAADGESLHSIMTWVQGLSEDARSGRGMSYPLLRSLLSRPVYVARHVSGDADVLKRPLMRWRPLVSDELWASVQLRLAARWASPRSGSQSICSPDLRDARMWRVHGRNPEQRPLQDRPGRTAQVHLRGPSRGPWWPKHALS
jgi:hypothetical protein